MSDLAKMIGQRIRNYRLQQHLSQEKLAELSGCHPTYIGQIERGEKNATLESIEKITSALKIPMSQLFEKIHEKESPNNIPMKSYYFFSQKSIPEQESLYRILIEIDRYKNE